MIREEFKKLYDLLELANPGEYEYNGEDTISNEVRRGIWVNIYNDSQAEGKDSWGYCYELRNANCKLWERHISDLQGKRQGIIEEIKHAADQIFTPEEYAKTSDAKISRNTARYEKQRDEEISGPH